MSTRGRQISVVLLQAAACALASAATQYTYDELNRLTQVQYDDGRSIRYVYDAAGNLLSRTQAGEPTLPYTLFADEFDGAALSPALWKVTKAAASGKAASYSVSGGALTISVPGGSCGSCGVTDGSRFAPQVGPFSGDFEMVLSLAELSRTAFPGSRDHSGVRLYYGTQSWIGLLGNYSHVRLPDGTTAGHRVIGYGNGGAPCLFDNSLSTSALYAMDLRIRRTGTASFMGYRLQGETQWREGACPLEASGGANIDVVSGDGGGTSQNGAESLKFERFKITAASWPSTQVQVAASAFVNGTNIATNDEPGNTCRNGLVYNAPPYLLAPNAGEWIVNVGAAGQYTMSVDVAAAEARPVDVYVNGALAKSVALNITTGGWCVANVQTIPVQTVMLAAGANVVRLQSPTVFPHLLGLRFSRAP